ncbi:MAG: hypothetical protein J6Z12_02120 [Paludibacteraceae bacterium]|nr:hypothetical protein [Paludibacteraceae bacterium]
MTDRSLPIILLPFFALLLSWGLLQLYFPIARKYGLLAGVNHRSSHSQPVITGAGFIFFICYAVYVVYACIQGIPMPWWMLAGLFMLAVVSFIDDLIDVWFLIRLIVQFFAITLMLLQIAVEPANNITMGAHAVQWLAGFTLLVLAVGTVNLDNFMDGINGMMGFLTLATLVPLILIDRYVIDYIDENWLYFSLVPTLLFLFYNARLKPKCFSGDVGAIVVGYVILYALLTLIVRTGNVAYILLLAVVYMEAGVTVLQRLLAGDNIFQSHRIHLFQLLVNEHHKPHLLVSGSYGMLQLGFGMALFFLNWFQVSVWLQNLLVWTAFMGCVAFYVWKKNKLMGGRFLSYSRRSFN